MLARFRRAACALAFFGALASPASAQSSPRAGSGVIIRERVELPPPELPSNAISPDPLCPYGLVGPYSVVADGVLRAVIVLTTAGDPADPA